VPLQCTGSGVTTWTVGAPEIATVPVTDNGSVRFDTLTDPVTGSGFDRFETATDPVTGNGFARFETFTDPLTGNGFGRLARFTLPLTGSGKGLTIFTGADPGLGFCAIAGLGLTAIQSANTAGIPLKNHRCFALPIMPPISCLLEI
jgi:hypothetical protein